jgi:prevent-host-death family protein
MKSVGSYEAKTHVPHLLSQVEKGETITITRRGKPIAVLAPADRPSPRDVKALIAEFRAYRARRLERVPSPTGSATLPPHRLPEEKNRAARALTRRCTIIRERSHKGDAAAPAGAWR